ncbi:hypothetical protein JWG44_21860 [Leptospira sp. 201903071]|uniref:hypothetical protein n=1 Tax=Leptospira ainazelensis TaxID=2810034 RepID=UPI0019645EFA|nr:hypothetical protein [Leptospira ainazelensis]MBM9502902.1 hypothetical protein [Leptospira ainazelensis]
MKFRIFIVSILILQFSCRESKGTNGSSENQTQSEIQKEKFGSQEKAVFTFEMGPNKLLNDLFEFFGAPANKKGAFFCVEVDSSKNHLQIAYEGLKINSKLLKDGTDIDAEKSMVEGSIHLPFEYKKEDQFFMISKNGKTLYFKKYLEGKQERLYLSFDLNSIKDQIAIELSRKKSFGVYDYGTRINSPYKIEHIVNCMIERENNRQFEEESGSTPQEDLNP